MSNQKYHKTVSAEHAFISLVSRVDWLNRKIEDCFQVGKPHDLYVQERDSIIWALDKIKELGEKLISKGQKGIPLLEGDLLNKLSLELEVRKGDSEEPRKKWNNL